MHIAVVWRHRPPRNMFVRSVRGFTSPIDVFPNKWQGNLTNYFLIHNIPPIWGVQNSLSPSNLKLIGIPLGKMFLSSKGVISQDG
jgi:hypothetical protein